MEADEERPMSRSPLRPCLRRELRTVDDADDRAGEVEISGA